MNNDLISRSALIRALEEDMKYGGVKTDEFDKGYDLGIKTAIEMLDNAPTVEPEKICVAKVTFDDEKLREIVNDVVEQIKSGEIVLKEEGPTDKWGKWLITEIRCPNCLVHFQTDCYSTEELNKCPVCGLHMRGAES